MIGASVSWCSRAAPQRPLQHWIEEGLAAWDRSLRGKGDELACLERRHRSVERLGRPARPLDADASHRRGDLSHDRGVEHLLLAEEADRPTAAGDGDRHRPGVEVAAVVHHENPGTLRRDVVDPVDVEAGIGHQLRAGELLEHALQLDSQHGDLEHARRDVEVAHRPAPQRRHHHHARVGVDDHRIADRRQQGRVEHAVGVGVALAKIDTGLLGPVADRGELALGPHERPDDRAVERPVGVDPIARGDDIVEAEPVGERLDEVVRRRRGDDHLATRLAVLVDERPGERLDHRRQGSGGGVAGLAHRVAWPPPGERGGLPGERHRRQRLADRVEDRIEQLLAGNRTPDEAGVAHRLGVNGAGSAGQQRPIQVEERRSRHERDCTAATNWARPGAGTLSTRTSSRSRSSSGPPRGIPVRPQLREVVAGPAGDTVAEAVRAEVAWRCTEGRDQQLRRGGRTTPRTAP